MPQALKQKLDNLKSDIPKRGISRTVFLILLITIIGFSLQILRFLSRGDSSLFGGHQSKIAKADTPGTTGGTTGGTTEGTTVGTTSISTTTGACTTEGVGTTDTGTTVGS